MTDKPTPPGECGPVSEIVAKRMRSLPRPEPRHLCDRWWKLAYDHAPADADEADLLLYAHAIDPDAWAFASRRLDRFLSLAAAMRVRRLHRSTELPAFTLTVQRTPAAPVKRSWISRWFPRTKQMEVAQ